MTGWRVGWVVAPKSQGTHWAIMSECFNTGASVFAQRACVTALEQGEGFVNELKAQYQQGRDMVIDRLGGHPAIDLCAPDGGLLRFSEDKRHPVQPDLCGKDTCRRKCRRCARLHLRCG